MSESVALCLCDLGRAYDIVLMGELRYFQEMQRSMLDWCKICMRAKVVKKAVKEEDCLTLT